MNVAALPAVSRIDLESSLARPERPRPTLRRPSTEIRDDSSRVDRAARAVAARGAGTEPVGVLIDSPVPQHRRPGEPRDSLSSPAAPLSSGPALLLYSLVAAYALVFGILI